jgi:hypothetical protein
MPLYPASASAKLDPELFRHPTNAYRGAPFWSWNCKLDRRRLLAQIDHLKAMGMGGFHMHSRVGLGTEYLGEEFLGHIKACVAKAKAEGMYAYLYDEDRWPSGFAGGIVTQKPKYRQKQLVITPRPIPDSAGGDELGKPGPATLLARYAVRLVDGRLAKYRRLGDGDKAKAGEALWHAYARHTQRSSWYNNFTYLDTLSRAAVEEFIAVTHERYRAAVGDDFGGVVPSIFTDEPAYEHTGTFQHAAGNEDVSWAWTDDFADTYRAAYGEDLLDLLPEVAWERPDGKAARTRYRFLDHLTERFAAAFADTIGDWCQRHGLMFTGHMMEEQTLSSQTHMIGEAMRSYRGFQLPGIDTLCDGVEINTAKQAQSASRQFGRPGVLSELYGVTNWDFDFTGHLRHGNWQAALGITLRVHHLSWVSMAGEAKRDYPAAIDEHSPWYREYPLIEDHFARLNTVLTRGKPLCRVGVIHPIESFWLCYGPLDQCQAERDEREYYHTSLTQWLLHGLVDFDFLAESLLPTLKAKVAGKRLAVGAMAYDLIIVPGLRTIRSTTLALLEAFAKAGGTVVFAGRIPDCVDAEPSDRPAKLARRCRGVAFTRTAVLAAVEPVREVLVRTESGGLADHLLHQLRQDGAARSLFICNTNRDWPARHATIDLRGQWRVTRLDTMTGEQIPLAATVAEGRTRIPWNCSAAGHILLRLEPAKSAAAVKPTTQPAWRDATLLAGPVPVTLSEPNALLLDQAEFRLDDGPWEPVEELLRLGNLLRARLGFPPRDGGMAQPWVEPPTPPRNRLGLRFAIDCAAPATGLKLALEGEVVSLAIDGRNVAVRPAGWWVDEAIRTVTLPDLAAGRHVLEVNQPLGRGTDLEWMYLLGDFGVEVRGRQARITAPVRELAFGDWTRQGLPFYGGNVTYHCRLAGAGGHLGLRVPRFKAPLITAALDGKRVGPIAFPPYRLDLGTVAAGERRLDLTVFGSRINTFGCVHLYDPFAVWIGPGAWRTTGDQWGYEYQLKPCGILTAPTVEAAS